MLRITACVVAVVVAFPVVPVRAQAALPFDIDLVEVTFAELPGLHSFAWAQHDGRWLIVTGRTNGLHGFTFNPFPKVYANNDVWVVDPATHQVWSASLDVLPDAVADPLRSTNPQYAEVDGTLYVVGGYGHSTEATGEITFPTLTVIDVPGLMQAVMEGTALASHLRQLTDERLKVTGGDLKHLDGRFYLVFGHLFDGFYRRDGTTFTQVYTEEVRSFRVEDDGAGLALVDYEAVADTNQFHRRDLTVAPVVFPEERLGFAAYGGVFQKDADVPFLNPVYYDGKAYTVDTAFEQLMSHYTCPALPLYDVATETMYTTFFGGIGQYFVDDDGHFVRDDDVPFIDEITTLTRYANGTSDETVWPQRLPALLGSNAVFIPDPGVPQYANGVLKLDALTGRTFVGYVFGGIYAEGPNRALTTASNRLFEVYVQPVTRTAVEHAPAVAFEVSRPFPNPFAAATQVTLTLGSAAPVGIDVFDVLGRSVARLYEGPLSAGAHTFTWQAETWPNGLYFVRVAGEGRRAMQAVLLAR